jgi:hypothetical protein
MNRRELPGVLATASARYDRPAAVAFRGRMHFTDKKQVQQTVGCDDTID